MAVVVAVVVATMVMVVLLITLMVVAPVSVVAQLSHMVTISSIGCEIMPACGVKSCPHVV
jgi:hypothetical protein